LLSQTACEIPGWKTDYRFITPVRDRTSHFSSQNDPLEGFQSAAPGCQTCP